MIFCSGVVALVLLRCSAAVAVNSIEAVLHKAVNDVFSNATAKDVYLLMAIGNIAKYTRQGRIILRGSEVPPYLEDGFLRQLENTCSHQAQSLTLPDDHSNDNGNCYGCHSANNMVQNDLLYYVQSEIVKLGSDILEVQLDEPDSHRPNQLEVYQVDQTYGQQNALHYLARYFKVLANEKRFMNVPKHLQCKGKNDANACVEHLANDRLKELKPSWIGKSVVKAANRLNIYFVESIMRRRDIGVSDAATLALVDALTYLEQSVTLRDNLAMSRIGEVDKLLHERADNLRAHAPSIAALLNNYSYEVEGPLVTELKREIVELGTFVFKQQKRQKQRGRNKNQKNNRMHPDAKIECWLVNARVSFIDFLQALTSTVTDNASSPPEWPLPASFDWPAYDGLVKDRVLDLLPQLMPNKVACGNYSIRR